MAVEPDDADNTEQVGDPTEVTEAPSEVTAEDRDDAGGVDEVSDVDGSSLSFLRKARDAGNAIVVVCNFTPVWRKDYRVGVPELGYYREILNTDSAYYEGGDIGNLGGVEAERVPWNNQPYSLKISLPPLAAVYFKLHRG